MTEAKILLKTKAAAPRTLLEKIGHFMSENKNSDPSQWPFLQFNLRDGIVLKGVLAEVKLDRTIESVSVMTVDGKGLPTGEMVFFESNAIVALTVINAKQFAPLLSGGDVARAPGAGEAPTKLGLKRKAAEVATQINSKAGSNITIQVDGIVAKVAENEGALMNVQDILAELSRVLEGVVTDQMGRESIAALSGIEFKQSSNGMISFSKENSTAGLNFDFEKALPTHWRDQLKDSLLSVL